MVGTASLYLACKVEEIYTPRIELFILATDNGYTHREILEYERKIAMELEWKLFPRTAEHWSNLCVKKWDVYLNKNLELVEELNIIPEFEDYKDVDTKTLIQNYCCIDVCSIVELLSFEGEDDNITQTILNLPAYKRFRQVSQIMDTLILDIDNLQYNQQALALSTIFCVVGLSLKIFSQKELLVGNINPTQTETAIDQENQHPNPGSSNTVNHTVVNGQKPGDVTLKNQEAMYKLKRMDSYVYLFSDFLKSEFSISYEELVPTLEFVNPYCGGTRFNYVLPHAFTYQYRELARKRIYLDNPSEIMSLIVHNNGSSPLVRWIKAQS